VLRANGTPVPKAHVKITARGSGREAVFKNGGSILVGPVTLHDEDGNGSITATLDRNSDLLPSSSYYVFEMPTGDGRTKLTPFQVPASGAGPFSIEDLLIDPPGQVESSALASHRVSVKDHGDISDTSPTAGQVLIWNGAEYVPGDTISTDLEAAGLVAVEAAARAAADTAEASARASAISSEASTRATADTAEATSRANADATLQNNLDAEATARANADSAHLSDLTDAHDASAVSYNGSATLSATDVEGALDELDTEKASTVALAAEAMARDAAIATAVANLINGAPGALDTLDELAAAFGDDPSFATTVTNALAGKQPLDSDLTAIGAIAPSNDDLIQRKAGAWTNRTPSQVKADLGITEADVSGLVADLAAKAADNLVVHLAGTETITGAKTFSADARFSRVGIGAAPSYDHHVTKTVDGTASRIDSYGQGLVVNMTHDWDTTTKDAVNIFYPGGLGDGLFIPYLGGRPVGYAGAAGGMACISTLIPAKRDSGYLDDYSGSVTNDRTDMAAFRFDVQTPNSGVSAFSGKHQGAGPAFALTNQDPAHPQGHGSSLFVDTYSNGDLFLGNLRGGSGNGFTIVNYTGAIRNILATSETGDVDKRFKVDTAGLHTWGVGSGAGDVILGRTGTLTLGLTGKLTVSNDITASRMVDVAGAMRVTGSTGLETGAIGPGKVHLIGVGASSVSARMLFGGDGSGWKWHLSRQTATSTFTDYLSVIDTGRVGINAASPVASLQITQAATADIGMMIKGIASLSGNNIEIRDSSDAILMKVNSAGSGTFGFPNTRGAARLNALSGIAGAVAFKAEGVQSQSADLAQFVTQTGASTFVTAYRFNKDGYPVNAKTSAPADADLSAGEMAIWFDSTNGAAKLKVKAKEAGGTVRTGELALT
jgi:hypothetical protein